MIQLRGMWDQSGQVMSVSVLIVDDDPVQRRLLASAVTRFGHEVVLADGGEAALARLGKGGDTDIVLVILDLVMPDLDGLTVMQQMAERGINLPVIVQTAKGGIETVIAAMRAGAFDFVVKPVAPARLEAAISNALKVEAHEQRERRAVRTGQGMISFSDLDSVSPVMRHVLDLGRRAAASDIPILIEGESGVGKELLARAIQAGGPRAGRPFVTVNCGAIPSTLVESVLFGHEKGAFTGATERHAGKFAEADGGTLFLDEVGELPLEAQVKLLRAVQQGEIDAVGARASRKVDIRLISATHRNLGALVEEGRFREDLYYRLNVFPIRVPPLRERREDIPGLVARFAARFAESEKSGRRVDVTERALALLKAYDWPGNIRQLENAIFRAVVLADRDILDIHHFPQIRAQVDGIDLSTHLEADEGVPAEPAEKQRPVGTSSPLVGRSVAALDIMGHVRPLSAIEKDMIVLTIQHYGGRMSEVARRLGIGRSTLYRKLKEYGISADEAE
jgi:DNA-binding NtrC family response regulator